MAYKTYLQMPAYVANGGAGGAALILAGAEFQVFAKDDYARTTPLPTFYLNGQPRSSLVSNRDGVIPPFMLDEVESAVWRNGELEGPLFCLEGITGAPGSNVLPLREALLNELMEPGEVKTYMDAEYRTAGLSQQVTAIEGTAASQEELVQSVVIPHWRDQWTINTGQLMSVWVAPFPCRITWAALSFDYQSTPASGTVSTGFKLRVLKPASSIELVAKSTTDEGITPRVAWGFAAAAWADATLDGGDVLGLDVTFTGGSSLMLPLALTFRYVPL